MFVWRMNKPASLKPGILGKGWADGRDLWRYAVAVGAVALAAAVRWGLHDVLGNGVLFITFYPAVAVVGMVAGGRAGMLATVLSALAADWLFMQPRHSLAVSSVGDVISLGLFSVAGAVISFTAGMLRRARKREWEALGRQKAAEAKLAELAVEQARNSLEEERNVLQAVMSGARNSHLVYLDRDFNFVRVNETYARTCGYTPEQMVGKNHFALYPNAENEAIFARVRDTGEPAEFHDKPFVFPDQPERGVTYWDWTLSPVKDAVGKVIGLVFSLFETTARKQVEEGLRESAEREKVAQAVAAERQRFYDVLETLPAMVCLLTPDYHVAFANRSFRERFGESGGRHCYEYCFGRNAPCDFCESYTVLKTGQPHHWEANGPDGSVIDAYDFPFTDVDGSPMILEMDLDITASKRAEEALRRANAYNRSLLEAGLDPLVTIGPDGKITDVSVATETATGFERTALTGTDFSDYFTEPEKARAGYQQVFREGFVRDYPLDLRHRDGHLTPVLYNASVYRDDTGKVIGVFAAARDITERKRAEAALKDANERLEQRVAERTARLTADLAALTRMHELSGRLLGAAGLQPLLQEVMDAAVAIMAANRGTLQLLEGNLLRILAHHGHQQPFLEFFASAENRASACGEATRRGQRVVVPDIEQSPLFAGTPSLQVLRDAGVRAIQSTPMVSRTGALLGILTTHWGMPHSPNQHDLWRIDLLARQAADLIEQARAEEALRQSDQRLKFVLETCRIGAWDMDIVDHTTIRSPEHDRIYGYEIPLPQWTYEMFLEHVVPEDRAHVDATYQKAVKNQSSWDFEFRIRRPDGQVRWIWATGSHKPEASGRSRRVAGIVLDITERKQAEDALRLSLREKEVMLKEIHHRVKNNLQVIASLVALQTDTLADPARAGLLQDVRDRVRSMALVHEKLYQSEDLARVDFADYARDLLNYLSHSHRRPETAISLKADLQSVSLSIDKAVPCGLILNELISNAFKHAFQGRAHGEITTALGTAPDGRVFLRVSDDGVGLPAGLGWQQSHSLGLRLIHLLAGQLHATAEVRTEGGTEFQIAFQADKETK